MRRAVVLTARYTKGGFGLEELLDQPIDDLFEWFRDAEAIEREVAKAVDKATGKGRGKG